MVRGDASCAAACSLIVTTSPGARPLISSTGSSGGIPSTPWRERVPHLGSHRAEVIQLHPSRLCDGRGREAAVAALIAASNRRLEDHLHATSTQDAWLAFEQAG